MLGAEDALQRVAAGAADQELLLPVGAREAREPFAVGELGGEVAGLVQLEVGLGAAARGDLERLRTIEDVAGRPDRDRVLAGLDPAIGEAVLALVIGHHRGGDGRAFLLQVDQDPFHGRLLGRGYLPGQDLRLGAGQCRNAEACRQRESRKLHCHLPDGLPKSYDGLSISMPHPVEARQRLPLAVVPCRGVAGPESRPPRPGRRIEGVVNACPLTDRGQSSGSTFTIEAP